MPAGLGNRLFPWARARLWAHLHGATMISPVWVNAKLGPILRRETDTRIYHDLFRKAPDDAGWLGATLAAGTLPALDEPGDLTATPGTGRGVVTFRGFGGYFAPLLGYEAFLSGALRQITRPRWLEEVDALPAAPIAMHVRLGDFAVTSDASGLLTRGGVRTPLDWFRATLRRVREALGATAAVNLFSDGREPELAPLLEEGNITFIRSSNAICGMLGLARGKVLIGTGGSSFGGWAAYLGGMPTVTHPGQDFSWYGLKNSDRQFIGVFDPGAPDPRFLRQVAGLA